MPTPPQELPVPFWPQQESGLSDLAGASPMSANVILDGKGAVRRRPCLASYASAPSTVIDSAGIDGIYITKDGLIFATGASSPQHNIYQISGGIARVFTGPQSRLAGSFRPTFAETEAMVAMAAGDAITKVLIDPVSVAYLGGNPPRATHVIANNSRLLCNDVDNPFKGAFFYSAPASGSSIEGHETWDSSIGDAGFISAEARPDPIVALYENTNEIFPFGQTTLQVFANDPQVVYSPLATREYGLSAPYSVVKRDQTFYWLDHKRRFVQSDGRSVDPSYGVPMQRLLNELSRVDDAFGYWVHLGPCDAIVWCFPTDGRSFAYQVGGGWSEWLGRDASGNNWSQFPVTAHFQNPIDAANVVGTSDGRMGMLSLEAQDDLGVRCTAFVETGFLNRGTDKLKRCVSLRLALQRGQTQATSEPVALLSWRDDEGPFIDPIEVSLGASGDRAVVAELRSLGVYKRRQWRFEFSGSEELVLAGAMEEFEVLEV